MNLTEAEAEALTTKIVQAGTRYVSLVIAAYNGRADKALGYRSWDAYVKARLRDAPRVTVGERKELVATLRKEGMTTREIAPVVGTSFKTVARDLVSNDTSAEVVSLAGRRRSAQGEAKPARKSGALAKRTAEVRATANGLTRWRIDPASATSEERWDAIAALTALIGNAETLVAELGGSEVELTHFAIDYAPQEAAK